MASLSTSLSLPRNAQHLQSGFSLKPSSHCVSVSFGLNRSKKLPTSASRNKTILTIQSAYRDDDGSGSTGLFVGGFILGGLIVGALGCVYAPQISKAIAGADRKDLMRKLPKFIYDEEKALEKTRKVLAEKIAQLNSAIDDVSSQLKSEDAPNGAALSTDEAEATV
ncbi:hypothetical protein AALP_AA7G095500 [Arabis alpina]|uniref:Localized to the inner membrane of the chloroplast n=1 Tax=Arabis alpina TaxID=50452 RepID=A0A087GH00_ARAAL|nr:hypothetical protein AALP_AA7G095500 [Arabis alpina]